MLSRSESVLVLLARCEQELAALLRPTLESFGLSLEHWRIVHTLSRVEYMAMTALAEVAAVSPSSSTRHIDQLVSQGLVLRQVDPVDRRKVVVALTKRGRTMSEKCAAAEDRCQTSMAESDSEVALLLSGALRSLSRARFADA